MNILGTHIYNKHIFMRYSASSTECVPMVSLHVRIYMTGAARVAALLRAGKANEAALGIKEAIKNHQTAPQTGADELSKLSQVADALERWPEKSGTGPYDRWILEAGYDFRVPPGADSAEGEVIDLWIYAPYDQATFDTITASSGKMPDGIKKELERLATVTP